MFSFFQKKARLRATLFAGLTLLFMAGSLFISCDGPLNTKPPVDAKIPNITGQPQGGTWNVSNETTFTLTVTANSADEGELSYQWCQNTTNSATGGTEIEDENEETLTLAKEDYTDNGNYYFYVVVTNTITDNGDVGIKTMTATSAIAAVTVTDSAESDPPVNAAAPTITAQPTGGTWDVSNTATFNLTVTANSTNGGSLSYQWYKNTANSASGGTAIGTTNPLSLAKGDYTSNGAYYFYVVVTNTITNNGDGGEKTADAVSDVVKVTVSGNAVATDDTPVNAAAPTITAQPTGATWNVNTNPAALSSINPKVTANSTDGGTLTYQWYRNTANSTSGGTLISGQTSATLSLTSIRSAYLSSGNGTRYVYVVVTNTNNNATGNKTATTTSSAAAIVMQGIVPFAPVAAWPTGTHNAGTTNFETIIQAAAGRYPSSLGFAGDSYWVCRFGDLTNAEKTSLGIPTSGTVQTRNGVTVTANDYIYGQDGWSGGGYSGVIRAIVSYGGNNNSAWRGAFVVEFITDGSWDAGNNRFFGYCFGFKTQDEIGTSTNMNVPTFTDSAAGVASTWTAANGPGINGNSNTYFGGWYRDPYPWPTN